MGLIKSIRNRTSLVVSVIAIGLLLFLLGGDLLSLRGLFGDNRNSIGEIRGKNIAIEEFQRILEQNVQQYRLNYQRNPEATIMVVLREQAWQECILRNAYPDEYEALGLAVSEAEMVDMVQGDHIRKDLQQSFLDQETGRFDKQKLQEYLQNIPNLPLERQQLWYDYERRLVSVRLHEKYKNLLLKSTYFTQADAKSVNQERNKRLQVRYLYVPHDNLPDDFTATDKEAKAYLKKHANDYQRPRSRAITYVSFPILASAEDTAYVQQEIQETFEAIQGTVLDTDSIFAESSSDGANPYRSYTPDNLPKALADQVEKLTVGKVTTPHLEGDRYVFYKISAIESGENEYMRASHLLIKADVEDVAQKAKARKKITRLLRKARNGYSFEALAREHGSDGTASSGGDLGWFTRGRMVPAFEKVAFNAKKRGLISKVVETSFGFHLIKVTQLPSKSTYKVSTIEKIIIARDESRDEAYQQAIVFQSNCRDTASFAKQANKLGIPVEKDETVLPNAARIGTLDARQVVQWLYSRATEDDVSDIFELEKNFVIAAMLDTQEEGTSNYEKIAPALKKRVINEKKSKPVIDKIEGQKGTLDELVTLFPNGTAYVYNMSGLKLQDKYLRNVGNDPKAIGAVFALQEVGDRSTAIATDNGVFLFELVSINEATTEQIDEINKELQSESEGKLYQNLSKAVEKLGDIKDERYKFF